MRKILIAFSFLCFISCEDEIKQRKVTKLDEYYKERNKSMELCDLIDSLTREKNGLSDWRILSEAQQIDWKQKGISGKDGFFNMPFARNGELYITLNDQFTHYVLEEKKEPVKWLLTLSGSRGGYSRIALTNDTYTHDFFGVEDYFKEKGILRKIDTVQCNDYDPWCQYYKMHLDLNGEDVVVIQNASAGGTAGPNVSLYFSSTGEDITMP
jgi:hypothetical protein